MARPVSEDYDQFKVALILKSELTPQVDQKRSWGGGLEGGSDSAAALPLQMGQRQGEALPEGSSMKWSGWNRFRICPPHNLTRWVGRGSQKTSVPQADEYVDTRPGP